jgi:tRNA-Thr(GGU) m(6)t(6)A37 methyltransferase TsaA
LKTIAHIYTDFSTKFGIPRQSGIVPELKAQIVFEPEYRNADALRGLEDFSHIWLIWKFSETEREEWSPTVRPPRLGGNKRMGVFATRSPFRPNSIGLSCVQLDNIEWNTPNGAVLHVSGIDLMNGTPIYDIKPYISYADSRPDARCGFVDIDCICRDVARRVSTGTTIITVDFPENLLQKIPPEKRKVLLAVLANNPRPSYQNDPTRVYGLPFAGFDVRFVVEGEKLRVVEVENETQILQ